MLTKVSGTVVRSPSDALDAAEGCTSLMLHFNDVCHEQQVLHPSWDVDVLYMAESARGEQWTLEFHLCQCSAQARNIPLCPECAMSLWPIFAEGMSGHFHKNTPVALGHQ